VHADDSFSKTKKDRQTKQGKKKIEKRSDRDIKEEKSVQARKGMTSFMQYVCVSFVI
jgi:hypothetical protein